jgi:hypothetical protein
VFPEDLAGGLSMNTNPPTYTDETQRDNRIKRKHNFVDNLSMSLVILLIRSRGLGSFACA